MTIDLKTLEQIAQRLREDAGRGGGLNVAAMLSIAGLIEGAIGAPVGWPSRVAGTHAADDLYGGNPSLRLAFNAGVKWAVESYQPTAETTTRPPRR